MAKFRRFANRSDALAYMARLNDDVGFPIVGKVNGIPAPQNQQTLRWCEAPIDCEDDKTAVPEMTDEWYAGLGIDDTEKANIIATYLTAPGATQEDYDPTWSPSDDGYTEIIGTGTVTAKSEQGVNVATNVQDDIRTTFWRGNVDPQWIMCEFPTPQTVVKFAVAARGGDADLPRAIGFPRNFVLQGSNNGVDFTNLRQLNDERFSPLETIRYRVPVANRAAYTYYRLRVTLSSNNANVSISKWRLFIAV